MKVYCSKCKHYRYVDDPWFGEWCVASDNVLKEDTYRRVSKRYVMAPEHKNKHNDCQSYKPSLFTRLFRRD